MNQKLEDEIKFKKLIKEPSRLFGWTYLYFFVLLVLLGIYYVKNINTVSFNQIPISYVDSLNIDRDVVIKKGGVLPAVDLSSILNPDSGSVSKGKELYDANCQSCHGSEGKGEGAAGILLDPKPRNFYDVDGWTNGRNFSDLYKTLQEGIIKNGMAAYEYLPPSDRIAIIQYIRSLVNLPAVNQEEVSILDTEYNLSEGVEVANQIPIKAAAEKIINESRNQIKKLSPVNSIDYKDNIGSQLFISYTTFPNVTLDIFRQNRVITDLNQFIKQVSAAPYENGFSSSIVNLSTEDWSRLHKYLLALNKSSLQ